jgi:large subunit ribosomal protein L1
MAKSSKKDKVKPQEVQTVVAEVTSPETVAASEVETKKETKQSKPGRIHHHSQRYLKAKKMVDRNKKYSVSEAIALAKQVSISKFDGSVEAHLLTVKEGLKGDVKFPHPLGKSQRIRIVDQALLDELEKGKIEFDLLVASPDIMPKLLKYARFLGPKGLMPNPKSGNIGPNPEKIVEEMAGKTQYKTEPKAPIIHVVFGKVKTEGKDLEDNLKALITAVGIKNITKVSIAPTMGPGIKIDLETI